MSYITVKDMNEVTHLIQTKNVVNLSFTDGIGIQHRLEFRPIVPLIKTLTFDLFNDRA